MSKCDECSETHNSEGIRESFFKRISQSWVSQV